MWGYTPREKYLNMVAQLGVLRFLEKEQRKIAQLYEQNKLGQEIIRLRETIENLQSQQKKEIGTQQTIEEQSSPVKLQKSSQKLFEFSGMEELLQQNQSIEGEKNQRQLLEELRKIKEFIQSLYTAKDQLKDSKQSYNKKISTQYQQINNFLFKEPDSFFKNNIQQEANPEFDFHYYSSSEMKNLLTTMTIQFNKLGIKKQVRIITADKYLFDQARQWFSTVELYGIKAQDYYTTGKEKCGYTVNFSLNGLSDLIDTTDSGIFLMGENRQILRQIYIRRSIEIKLNSGEKKWSIKFRKDQSLDDDLFSDLFQFAKQYCKNKQELFCLPYNNTPKNPTTTQWGRKPKVARWQTKSSRVQHEAQQRGFKVIYLSP